MKSTFLTYSLFILFAVLLISCTRGGEERSFSTLPATNNPRLIQDANRGFSGQGASF